MQTPCAGILTGHSSTGLNKQLDDVTWELRKAVPGEYACRIFSAKRILLQMVNSNVRDSLCDRINAEVCSMSR